MVQDRVLSKALENMVLKY